MNLSKQHAIHRGNSMATFTTFAEILNDWLGDINPEEAKPSFPYGVRVGCVKMASPRHERFDLIRDAGAELLDKIFNNEPITDTCPVLMFPERHLSVHEQQSLMARMNDHVSASNFERVDIITSSPLIIGNFTRDIIRILTWEDDHKHDGTFN